MFETISGDLVLEQNSALARRIPSNYAPSHPSNTPTIFLCEFPTRPEGGQGMDDLEDIDDDNGEASGRRRGLYEHGVRTRHKGGSDMVKRRGETAVVIVSGGGKVNQTIGSCADRGGHLRTCSPLGMDVLYSAFR